MGLTLHYDLALPAERPASDVAARIDALRARAAELPFRAVSDVVRLDGATLAGPSPIEGLRYRRLEDVAHVGAAIARELLYRETLGRALDDDGAAVDVPAHVGAEAIAFAVAPGDGCEPATFGLARLTGPPSRWTWWCGCKTQYASVVGDAHFVRCHTSLVALLDAAAALGIAADVRDDSGYWAARDPGALLASVAHMNRVVARFAGALTDALRAGGGDSRGLHSAIFGHPDFERLETEPPNGG